MNVMNPKWAQRWSSRGDQSNRVSSSKEDDNMIAERQISTNGVEAVRPSARQAREQEIKEQRRETAHEWQRNGLRPIEMIPLGKLSIDHTYQRDPDEAYVRRIVNTFDAKMLGELEVNVRLDGRIVLIDGQHRYLALCRIVENSDLFEVPCLVNRVPDVAAEAKLYLARNAFIRPATRNATFAARMLNGDQIAIDTFAAIEKAGYTPYTSKVTRVVPSGSINASACETITKSYGVDILSHVLRVLRLAYGDQHEFQTKFIGGLGSFYGRFRDDPNFDAGKLVKILRGNPPDVLMQKGSNNKTVLNVSNAQGVAMAIHFAYNYGAQKRLAGFPV